ncbi:unnamed protein product [Symbiodinium natans]|uniref:Uncharacterized protein n=1 Tax=Symbiodinium natans TaxID=878477 RepID=A0A812KK25_9DINO|nr:unnamed protein product [Symbiodinium natans]
MAQMSLCLLFSLVTMGVAVRSESESELIANGTESHSADWCWNCCKTPKCSGIKYMTSGGRQVFFQNCQAIEGKWEVEGTAVKPEMLGSMKWKFNSGADYMCREDCAVFEDTGAIRPPKLFSHQTVYRAGGVADGLQCAFGLMEVNGKLVS